MKASELRIGNLISDTFATDKFNGVVKKVQKDKVFYNGFVSKIEDIKPIPITEEWLLKFGFETIIVENYPLCIFNQLAIEIYTDNCVVIYNNIEVNKIKHVHQLQNLYFALTQNELTIKK